MLAPIVLFVYNRPNHTQNLLASLLKNKLASDSELYVFCDGPKNKSDQELQVKVLEVRTLIRDLKGFKTVHVFESENNKGLAASVIDGVSKILAVENKVIVLEDDLVLSDCFLEFMNNALVRYEEETSVMQISGYSFPIRGKLPDTYFLNFCSSWGWATWSRAWKYFEPSANLLLNQFDNSMKKKFDFNHTYNFYRMLSKAANKKNDSWAIRWYASIFLHNGLTLFPKDSFVNNSGNDNSGVHSIATDVFNHNKLSNKLPEFTSVLEEDKQIRMRLSLYYLKIKFKMLPAYLISLWTKYKTKNQQK